jgi:hypothetical protein
MEKEGKDALEVEEKKAQALEESSEEESRRAVTGPRLNYVFILLTIE